MLTSPNGRTIICECVNYVPTILCGRVVVAPSFKVVKQTIDPALPAPPGFIEKASGSGSRAPVYEPAPSNAPSNGSAKDVVPPPKRNACCSMHRVLVSTDAIVYSCY